MVRFRSLNEVLQEYYASGQFLSELGSDDPEWATTVKLMAEFVAEEQLSCKYEKGQHVLEHVLKRLLNVEALGLPSFGDLMVRLEELRQFEEKAFKKQQPLYRDHYIHSIYVFVLGLYLFFNLCIQHGGRTRDFSDFYCDFRFKDMQRLRKFRQDISLNEEGKTEQRAYFLATTGFFIYQWIFASLLHDFGYASEVDTSRWLGGSVDLPGLMAFLKVVGPLKIDISRLLEEGNVDLATLKALYLKGFNSPLAIPKSKFGRDKYSSLKSFIDILVYHIQRASRQARTEKEQERHILLHIAADLLAKEEGKHHAAFSALDLLDYFNIRFGKLSAGSDAGAVFLDYMFYQLEGEMVASIFLHNYFLDHIEKIHLLESPIAYMLVLCDEIQEMGRPSLTMVKQAVGYPMSLNRVKIRLPVVMGLCFRFVPSSSDNQAEIENKQSRAYEKLLSKLEPRPVSFV